MILLRHLHCLVHPCVYPLCSARAGSPWALKGTRVTKHSGNRSAMTDDFDDGPGAGFNMEGEVLKRGRTMKAWQSRYFKQNGNVIEYFPKKGDPPSKVITAGTEGVCWCARAVVCLCVFSV